MSRKVITLTRDQATNLSAYLNSHADERKRILEDTRRFASEMNEDGTPKYPTAQKSVEFWEKFYGSIDAVCEKITKAPYKR